MATINVTRTGGTGAATISYATVDGSATSGGTGADYTPAAGVLNFAAGQTTASFTVTALIDSILESPETVNLVLSGGNVGSNPSILTILDGPPGTTVTPTPTPATTVAPTPVATYFFGAANYSVTEGSGATITINRSGNLSQASAILFRTGDGSASSPADYNSVTQGVFFAAGQTSAQVSVQTLFDNITGEPNETVNLFLAGGSLASPSVAVLSIIDPSFLAPTVFSYGASPGSISDGGVGTFTITRTGNISGSAAVDYLIAPPGPGQPLNTIDYTISPAGSFSGGTVNFNPGQTSVSLTISNPFGFTGGNVGLGFAPGTIVGAQGSATITLL